MLIQVGTQVTKQMAENPGAFWLGVACAAFGLVFGYALPRIRRQPMTKLQATIMFGLILVGAYLMGVTEIFTDVVDKVFTAVRGN